MKKQLFSLLILFFIFNQYLFSQESTFKNDICIPAKLYMLSDTQNDLFIEPLIKRWRPYHDFVRFSGNCSYSRLLQRVASVNTPQNKTFIQLDLINADEFQVIKSDTAFIYVGEKGTGQKEVKIQILGDSYVDGAFFRDAILTKKYVPKAKLIGIRKIKGEENQYDEGRGGWTLKKYFEIPKDDKTPYHGFMQPNEKYTYWGSCGFWKNCHKVINGELIDFESVYSFGRYDQCVQQFDSITGYLLTPEKNHLMFDNSCQKYVAYNGKKCSPVEINEHEWRFNYAKYLTMWNLEGPDFFAQMLGLNDFRYTLTSDFEEWNKLIVKMKESYYEAVPNGKFIILIPCSTTGSINNTHGYFTTQYNAAMWQLRKNIIDTFDNRENEGFYVVDIGITIDNEEGYNRNEMGIQTGNPHPYPNYPTMGIPLAAFIQYHRR